jgi:hypothetical protein
MKRIVALGITAVALAIPAAQAGAASSAGPTLAQYKALQRQVATLQKEVKALQQWVPKSCSSKSCISLPSLSANAAFTYEVEICQQAVIADAFQGTWSVIDQISQATQAGKTYFGAQTAISDKSACSNVRLTRATGVPPSAAIFNSLVTLLTT